MKERYAAEPTSSASPPPPPIVRGKKPSKLIGRPPPSTPPPEADDRSSDDVKRRSTKSRHRHRPRPSTSSSSSKKHNGDVSSASDKTQRRAVADNGDVADRHGRRRRSASMSPIAPSSPCTPPPPRRKVRRISNNRFATSIEGAANHDGCMWSDITVQTHLHQTRYDTPPKSVLNSNIASAAASASAFCMALETAPLAVNATMPSVLTLPSAFSRSAQIRWSLVVGKRHHRLECEGFDSPCILHKGFVVAPLLFSEVAERWKTHCPFCDSLLEGIDDAILHWTTKSCIDRNETCHVVAFERIAVFSDVLASQAVQAVMPTDRVEGSGCKGKHAGNLMDKSVTWPSHDEIVKRCVAVCNSKCMYNDGLEISQDTKLLGSIEFTEKAKAAVNATRYFRVAPPAGSFEQPFDFAYPIDLPVWSRALCTLLINASSPTFSALPMNANTDTSADAVENQEYIPTPISALECRQEVDADPPPFVPKTPDYVFDEDPKTPMPDTDELETAIANIIPIQADVVTTINAAETDADITGADADAAMTAAVAAAVGETTDFSAVVADALNGFVDNDNDDNDCPGSPSMLRAVLSDINEADAAEAAAFVENVELPTNESVSITIGDVCYAYAEGVSESLQTTAMLRTLRYPPPTPTPAVSATPPAASLAEALALAAAPASAPAPAVSPTTPASPASAVSSTKPAPPPAQAHADKTLSATPPPPPRAVADIATASPNHAHLSATLSALLSPTPDEPVAKSSFWGLIEIENVVSYCSQYEPAFVSNSKHHVTNWLEAMSSQTATLCDQCKIYNAVGEFTFCTLIPNDDCTVHKDVGGCHTLCMLCFFSTLKNITRVPLRYDFRSLCAPIRRTDSFLKWMVQAWTKCVVVTCDRGCRDILVFYKSFTARDNCLLYSSSAELQFALGCPSLEITSKPEWSTLPTEIQAGAADALLVFY